jgi:hypothetical protein
MTKSDSPRAGDDFLNLFRRGLAFTEELLAENERLRFQLAALQTSAPQVGPREQGANVGVRELLDRIHRLEEERAQLKTRTLHVEQLNRDYQARYAEIEVEHNNLANLYIASYQLHASLSFAEVTRVVSEIVINLVGAARFVLYLLDTRTDHLVPLAAEGVALAGLVPIARGEGPVGRAVARRERLVPAVRKPGEPWAVVPLATEEGVVGVLVVDELLTQKPGLAPIDIELFNLLSVQAASMMAAAYLREQASSSPNVIDAQRALSLAGARA